ncbi:type II toxin-antitoxin system VapC family toxin [Vibrio coralliilyticus]|uniref:type II toxin-antitoxin system VapC family toxin n=1 Tax=Vibrio coralliilyticus TaxID=190893 RepID=UPI000C169240|nr:type II toxin-antitoxin system VapC family toxin [Vibrio coralliilyticus]
MKFNPYDNFVFFDSCAFDGGDLEMQEASTKARRLLEKNKKKVMLMHSVVDEVRNPHTPDWIQDLEPSSRKTVKLNLTSSEQATLVDIESIIVGNGKPEKRKADCFHVFEAQKYGGCFVTSDYGILKHSVKIKERYGLYIVGPLEFLTLVQEFNPQT